MDYTFATQVPGTQKVWNEPGSRTKFTGSECHQMLDSVRFGFTMFHLSQSIYIYRNEKLQLCRTPSKQSAANLAPTSWNLLISTLLEGQTNLSNVQPNLYCKHIVNTWTLLSLLNLTLKTTLATQAARQKKKSLASLPRLINFDEVWSNRSVVLSRVQPYP